MAAKDTADSRDGEKGGDVAGAGVAKKGYGTNDTMNKPPAQKDQS